jgi:hypothetical protein
MACEQIAGGRPCCDREYHMTCVIRTPAVECRRRDLLRLKGDMTDFCVIGEINVKALRQFQSSHRSPAEPYKPVPDGYEIDF